MEQLLHPFDELGRGYPWGTNGIDVYELSSTDLGSAGSLIEGNLIGTDVTGTKALGDPFLGIALVNVGGITVGGTAAGAGNVIAACSEGGIGLISGSGGGLSDVGSSDNLIEGNLIGINFDSSGNPISGLGNGGAAFPQGNDEAGIYLSDPADPSQVSSNNTIGGTAAGAANVISDNSCPGVIFSGAGVTGNLLEGNRIGTNAAGTAALGNAADGVLIQNGAIANTVGGTASAAGNVIAFNASIGVAVGVGATDHTRGQRDSVRLHPRQRRRGRSTTISNGLLTISNSTIAGNSTSGSGGGVVNESSGTVTITSSTIANNSASQGGGGIENFGALTLTNSTIADNKASGGEGGGIDNAGTLATVNSTIAYNTSPFGSGGGLYDETSGFSTLDNTIVAQNTGVDGPDDIAGAAVSSTSMYNLVGVDETQSLTDGTDGNQVGVADPGLGALANNGGPTQTIALLAGSPAINRGDNALAVDPQGNPLTTDERGVGFPRIVGGTVDIGAYESPYVPTATSVSPSVSSSAYGQSVTFTATVSSPAGVPPDGSVQFLVNGAAYGSPVALSGARRNLLSPSRRAATRSRQSTPATPTISRRCRRRRRRPA